MQTFYYTAKAGRRNACGHVTTTGDIYVINGDFLCNVGNYAHMSGGAGIERTLLSVVENYGANTHGGYFAAEWRNHITFEEI